jgi:hypothetical protein
MTRKYKDASKHPALSDISSFDEVETQGLDIQCLLDVYSAEQSLTNFMQ